jgi:hypothetical protein
MKKWLVLGGMVAVLIVGGYLLLSHYAVKFIEPYLRKGIGGGLTAGEIKIKATYLSAKKVQYVDPQSGQRLLQIEEVRVYPSLQSLLTGHPRIREFLILDPIFYVSRSREGVLTGPLPPLGKREKDQGFPGQGKMGENQPVPTVIDKIRIERGSIDFKDGEYGDPPVGMELNDLTFKIEDIHFPPVPAASPFELKGKMKGRTKEGEIEAKGWIALQPMTMEVLLKVQGVEVKTFEPYYRKRVSAEIESGDIHLEAKISVRQRMIDAPGTLELIDLHIKEGGTVFWVPAQILVSLLKAKDNRIKARFRVKGDMDDPRFNLQESFFTRTGIALAEALGIPIKIVGESVLGGAEKGGGGLEEGLKSIGDLFKKKERKQ